jgi:hypothetical protein
MAKRDGEPSDKSSEDERISIPLDPEDPVPRLLKVDREAKAAALRRLRFASDEELALFEGKLREDALRAGATEQEVREAQRTHPEHS